MVKVDSLPDATGAAAWTPPGLDATVLGQLQDALGSGDKEALAKALTAFRNLPDNLRTNVMQQLDPAALQVLLEALMEGSPELAQAMKRFQSPSLQGRSNPSAPARHYPITNRTNGISPNDPAPSMAGAGKKPAQLYEKHQGPANDAQLRMSPSQSADAQAFRKNYEQNKSRYDAVAEKTNMPPELIAAIHWRESNGNFNTYLHQGDPLGRPATHVPTNIPVFNKWEDAAVHALGMNRPAQQALGLTKDSTDKAAMASYAELYNGLGYHYRNQPSPYVYAGTNKYSSGKYVSDGVYDPNAVDRQVGVLALMTSLH